MMFTMAEKNNPNPSVVKSAGKNTYLKKKYEDGFDLAQ